MLLAWLVFPLVLAALTLGCGLLVARAVPLEIPAPLLMPLGFAAVSLIGQFALLGGSATVTFAAPVVVALAVAGIGLSIPPRSPGRHVGLALAVVGAFVVFSAPFVLSGLATFGGYIKLDDTATYLAMLDRAMRHGYDVGSLPPSTYEATLATSLAYGYPLGSLVPLGIGRELVGQDLAWLWQPYLAFLAALLASGLYQLAAGIVRAARLRALVAVVGAQAALLYGYALWGGVKELAVAVLVVLLACLVKPTAEAERHAAVVPLALASAAVVGTLSVGGSVWIAVPLAVTAVLTVRRFGWEVGLLRSVGFAACALILAVPSAVLAVEWLHRAGAFTSSGELGNLIGRLSWLQVFGIWPEGDFRVVPHNLDVVHVLALLVGAAALLASVAALRRGAWGLPVALGSAGIACIAYVGAGSPWIGGKALASASPIVLAAALAGAAATFEGGRRVEGAIVAGVIITGVGWSNVLQYRAVDLAPAARLSELARIGNRFAGQGPTLMTEYEPYGARHFLRKMDAEAASELRRRFVRLRNGGEAATGESPDIDEIALSEILPYRTLVLRRSGLASRPPSVYSPIWNGRVYQVWQRADGPSPIIEHLSLGSRLQPAAVPHCSDVLRLARRAAGTHGVLATVVRAPAIVIETDGTAGPPTAFGAYGEDPDAPYLTRSRKMTTSFVVRSAASYGAWIGGSFKAPVEIDVDGRRVGRAAGKLNWPGTFTSVGAIRLGPGSHLLRFRYSGPSLRPGSGGTPPFGTGPIGISASTGDTQVTFVRPESARTLCGKSLDWIEALRG